jgi:hypothetical protein
MDTQMQQPLYAFFMNFVQKAHNNDVGRYEVAASTCEHLTTKKKKAFSTQIFHDAKLSALSASRRDHVEIAESSFSKVSQKSAR